MQTYKTVVGDKAVNAHTALGWKCVHVFTKPSQWSDDGNSVTEHEAAFVLFWDSFGDPAIPENPHKELLEPT